MRFRMEKDQKPLISIVSTSKNVKSIFENKTDENLLTKEMLAEKLSFSVSYINKLMKQRKIPAVKTGRSVRFKYSDVVAALERNSAA